MNRHGLRVVGAESRERARILSKFIPDDFASVKSDEQALTALRLAYKAFHLGKITKAEARVLGCVFGGRK